MDVLVIEPNSDDNFQLLVDFAKKLGSKVATLEKEEVEDVALHALMKKMKTGKKVSRGQIMKELES